MSMFDGQVSDLSSATPFTNGAAPTFTQALSAAFEDQTRRASAWGAEADFSTIEQQQLDKIFKATGERITPLGVDATVANSRIPHAATFTADTPYTRGLSGETLAGSDAAAFAAAQGQMQRVAKLAAENPSAGILNYDQMWQQVVQQAHTAASTEANLSSRTPFWSMGTVGGFLGGVAGSMTDRDPVNVLTSLIGAPGKSMIAKVLGDIGIQGLGHAADTMTGAYENEKMLGFNPTVAGAAEESLATGVGAGVMRGAGEVLAPLAKKGFAAIAAKFGAKAPDVATAVGAKEVEDVVGKSPIGDTRMAQGAHDAEVANVLNRDTPLNLPGLHQQVDPSFNVAAFASRDSDHLFQGTTEPLSNIFDRPPQIGDPASIKVAEANQAINEITPKIAEADAASAHATKQIEEIKSEAADRNADDARLAEVNDSLKDQTMNPRERGRLVRERVALEDKLNEADARAAEMEALTKGKDRADATGTDLRIQRAKLVVDTARGMPDANRAAPVDSGAAPAATSATSAASVADQAEAKIAEPEAEPGEPKIIPPPEGAGPDVKEMVDLGQHSGPVDLDHPVVTGVDAEGNAIHSTIRQVLEDHKDDEDLVANMKSCLLSGVPA